MKTRHTNKKALSLILAVIMLLGVMPMGAFSVSAITVPDTNAEGQQTYEIATVDDWNAVATASKNGNDFSGDIVKLTADIGGTEGTPIELPALFTADFKGTFDGNGRIISNVIATDVLIAKSVAGATLENFTLSNVSGTGNSLIAIVVAAGETKMTGITISGCTLTSAKATVNTYTISGAGMFAGYLAGLTSTITIDGCEITNSTLITSDYSGMAVGITRGNVNVLNSSISGNIELLINYLKVGGVLGFTHNYGQTVVIDNNTVNVNITHNENATGDTNGGSVALVFGEMSSNVSAEILNCNVQGSVNSPAKRVAGIVGTTYVQSGKYLKVENVTVNANLTSTHPDCTVDNETAVPAVAGGIALITSTAGQGGDITFNKVKIEGTITTANTTASGLVGVADNRKNTAATFTSTSTLTVTNCEIIPTINTGIMTWDRGTAMVIAVWGGHTNWYSYNSAAVKPLNASAVSIENCIIGGTINYTGTKWQNAFGGVIGHLGYQGGSVTVNSCVLSTAFTGETVKPVMTGVRGVAPVGLVIGQSHDTNAPVTIVNSVTTLEGTVGTDWYLISRSSQLVVNGTATGSVHDEHNDDSVLSVDATAAATMVERDSNGFIHSIGGHVTTGYMQYTAIYGADTGLAKYAVRFIALSQIDAPAGAGFTVVVTDASGTEVKTFSTGECKLYDELKAYSPDGSAQLGEYVPEDFGAKKFFAIIIEDIPAVSTNYTFKVTPYYVTAGGLTVTGVTQNVTFVNGVPQGVVEA